MKILVVNSYASKGGAARAASRLVGAITAQGVGAEYVSIYGVEPTILDKVLYYARILYDRLPAFFIARRRIMFSSGGFSNLSLIRYINSSSADLVHLHWVNAGGMSVSDIARIKK